MPFEIPQEEPELPVGSHDVEVLDARAGTSRNGNDMLIFDLADAQGRGHTAFVTITPKSMWKVREVFDAFGLEVPAAGEDFDEQEFIGLKANVEIVDQQDGYPPKVNSWDRVVGSDIPDDLPPEPKPPADDEPLPF